MKKLLNKRLSNCISAVLVCCLLLAVCAPVFAAPAMKGSGTAKDPYIVTNAEQFDAIRNNLSAHYKLGDTVDLSSIDNFTPIGTLARPFTGSLTCELGADGFPKYAVKNLKVYIPETAYVAQNKSKWEAAAFGAAQGATFSNIYMLNVLVTNDNYGDNTGNVVYGDYKPGMDEMASAALVGFAKECVIMGCMSSGKIDTSSNNAGGLVGNAAEGTTIANCYSTADVLCKGLWGTGGLVGTLNDSTLSSSCYLGGSVSNGSEYSSQGMLFATATSCIISDCYAVGKALGGVGNIGQFKKCTISNVYSSANAEKPIPDEYIGTVTNPSVKNVFLLDTVTTVSINVNVPKASAAEIKAAFAASSAWEVSGELPVLKDVKLLSDESRYVPGAEAQPTEAPTTKPTEAPTTKPTEAPTAVPTQDTAAPTQGTEAPTEGTQPTETAKPTEGTKPTETEKPTEGTQSTETETPTEDTQEPSVPEETVPPTTVPAGADDPLAELSTLAQRLPGAEELTAEHIDDVLKANGILTQLSDAQYSQLDPAVEVKVSQCYSAIQTIMLEYMVQEVEKLELEQLTAQDQAAVLRLQSIYESFEEATKDAYSTVLAQKLRQAVEKVQQPASNDTATVTVQPMSAMEITVIVLLAAIAVIIFAVNITVTVLVLKKRKTPTEFDADEAE